MKRRVAECLCVFVSLCFLSSCNPSPAPGEVTEVRIPKGAGGVGFLPLLVMEKYQLIEKHAREAGAGDLRVRWIDIGGAPPVDKGLASRSAGCSSARPPPPPRFGG